MTEPTHDEAVPTVATSPDVTPLRAAVGGEAGHVSGPAARYRLEEEIGRGGMGVVHRAFDPDLDRTLAVKLLLPEHHLNPDLERRFLEEARLTGQLQHPGIPPVHDVGRTLDGRPFFALKLVRGRTLAHLLKERSPSDMPRLLGVFAAVCQAIGYAHSRGVLHRDLKPANVMVGAFGEVQVMDWGLAKVLSRSGEPEATAPAPVGEAADAGAEADTATRAGAVLGTPAYMAPEQARGEPVDARADVFGLGAVLCVILTEQPPFNGPSLEEIRRKAASAELTEATAALERCGADAELVALARACLAAEAKDRPADGGAVADAMARYQAGVAERLRQAELARARAQERVAADRKRRRLTRALAAAAVLLAAVLGGAGWYAQRQAQADMARQERDEALARQEADTALTQAVALRDRGLWESAEDALKRAEQRPAALGLEDVLARLASASTDLALARDLDKVRQDKALLVDGKLNVANAPAAYEAALKRHGFDVLGGEQTDLVERIGRSAIKAAIVSVLEDWACLESKDPPRRARLLALARRADPGVWTDRFRDPAAWDDPAAIRELTASADPSRLTAVQAEVLAKLLGPRAEEGLRLLHEAWRRRPGDFWLSFTLANALIDLKGHNQPEALSYYRAALAVRPNSVTVHNDLGIVLEAMGDREAAITSFRTAIEVDPTDVAAHYNLGLALYGKGDMRGAIASYRAALERDRTLAQIHYNLGLALQADKDLDAAITSYKAALDINPRHARAHCNLGTAYYDKGDRDAALECYDAALKFDPSLSRAHSGRGLVLQDRGDREGAIKSLQAAIDRDARNLEAHYNLGLSLYDKKDFNGAARYFRAALDIDGKHARSHHALANVLHDKGDVEGAVKSYRATLALEPKNIKALQGLGIAQYRLKDMDGAIESFEAAVAHGSRDPVTYVNLGIALYAKKDYDRAIASFKDSLAVNPKDAVAHYNLGIARHAKDDVEGAIESYRAAVLYDPRHAEAHCNLGQALREVGKLTEALESLREGHRLGSANPRWPYASARWVQDCERLVFVDGKLKAILDGGPHPRDASELMWLAYLCQQPYNRRFALAARFYADAFAAQPDLAGEQPSTPRSNAASAALLAAAGEGKDLLPDKVQFQLRRQALAWVRGELAALKTVSESADAKKRAGVVNQMRRYQQGSDFASVRAESALATLPEADREAWRAFWADLAALLASSAK